MALSLCGTHKPFVGASISRSRCPHIDKSDIRHPTPSVSEAQLWSRPARRLPQAPQAGLFGFGGSDKEDDKKAARRARDEEQMEIQRAVLARRKNDSWRDQANARRADVKRYETDKEYKKKVDEERKKRKPQQEDPKLWGSIIIPLPNFGDSAEERFDLRGPYSNEGWVDEGADNSLGAAFKRAFGIGVKFDNDEDDSDQKGSQKGKQKKGEPKKNIFGW